MFIIIMGVNKEDCKVVNIINHCISFKLVNIVMQEGNIVPGIMPRVVNIYLEANTVIITIIIMIA